LGFSSFESMVIGFTGRRWGTGLSIPYWDFLVLNRGYFLFIFCLGFFVMVYWEDVLDYHIIVLLFIKIIEWVVLFGM